MVLAFRTPSIQQGDAIIVSKEEVYLMIEPMNSH